METEILEDDWNPDPQAPTILSKFVVDCSDKQLKKTRIMLDSGNETETTDKISDDDLLKEKYPEIYKPQYYDGQQDEKNQEWVNKNYKKINKMSNSTVLCCPMCFTQVCYESQAHEYYENQFRAVFVHNVRVDMSKQIQLKNNSVNGQGKDNTNQKYIQNIKFKKENFLNGQYQIKTGIEDFEKIDERAVERGRELFEMFFAVECDVCHSELGVYEVDSNIYHFHSAVPGVG